jgi:aldose 1-epimerase
MLAGPIVGRYANRIKNSTFTVDGQTYHVTANDHGGLDTLHGGMLGYDARNWTVVASNDSSITFGLLDTGFEGFPGTVYTLATYSVSTYASGPQGQVLPRLTTSIISSALDAVTPIMLSTHIYWNLNAFKAETVLNDTTLWLPYADRYIATDGILIPTGIIGLTSERPALDFLSPKLLGDSIDMAQGVCGTGCTGVDNAFILGRPAGTAVLKMWSNTTGIQMDVSHNQRGFQIYTCNGQNGTIPVKQSQQDRNQGTPGATGFVQQHGCVVIEPQVWIDGINHPEWGVDQYEIFSPDTGPLVYYATYDFSTY